MAPLSWDPEPEGRHPVNDPVEARLIRIEEAMEYTTLTREEATAKVDAEIEAEEAIWGAYFRLMQALREGVAA